MASRKTYFGIGWPKDAPDPESGGGAKGDPEDRSAPTVVDDEKVAEGLKQLRSWYQGESQDAIPEKTPKPAPVQGSLVARPTAVGHATAPPAAAAAQRPVAPDPMRATMYGHDVHRFDLEPPPAADREPPQPAASTSTALVVADPARQQVEAVPGAVGRSTSDPFQPVMLGMGEAERLPRSARRSGAYVPPRPSSRIPLASRIMFGVGLGALLLAAAFWYQTSTGGGATSEAPPAPAPAQPAHAAQPATPIQAAPAAPAPERAAVPPPAPERPSVASTPTPIPAAPVAIPRSAQLRLSNPPPPPRTPQPPHRHHEVKPEVGEPTEVGEALLPFAPSVGEKTAEPKDVKERATDTAAREPKDVKETKEMKAKESADLKPAIEPKPAFEPKETKETKETKAKKSAKGRTGDVDATLPPSAD